MAVSHASAFNNLPISDEPQKSLGFDLSDLEKLLAEGKAAAEAKAKETAIALDQESYPSPNASHLEPASDRAYYGLRDIGTSVARSEQVFLPARRFPAADYHNVENGHSRLASYKERQNLEQEASGNPKRLQNHAKEFPALLALMPPRIAPQQHPPYRQPATLQRYTNAIKRARSPEPVFSAKCVCIYENPTRYSMRGTSGAQSNSVSLYRGRSDPSSARLEQRVNHAERRRKPADGPIYLASCTNGFRGLSTRHCLKSYKIEAGPADSVPPPGRRPRLQHNLPDSSRCKLGYSSVNKLPPNPSFHRTLQQYRGSTDLGLQEGGVRYFIIKSWNYENVVQAMSDGEWVTQVKNEYLLTEAYKTSRHVILLFSVNKSMQFQGYALMASPPDPLLPKPSFVAKLNWATSPTFTLRWFARTAVHFGRVRHLKNELKRNNRNQPMAVRVGKDGQEISSAAGIRVVEILDHAERSNVASSLPPGPSGRLC